MFCWSIQRSGFREPIYRILFLDAGIAAKRGAKENASCLARVTLILLMMTCDVKFQVFDDAALFFDDIANNVTNRNHSYQLPIIYNR